MTFRKDINALRALAVLAVAFYHFGVPFLTGGFVGVDVFFVISGYLMTSIIVGGIEKNRFSILKFYWARAKRIIPALAFVCLASLILGWYWMAPLDYAQLGKHAAAALAFVSNVTFKGEQGYFDTLSKDKWLLHTWSLAVEWQFYLVFPFLITWTCRKMKDGILPTRRLAIVFAVVMALSLGLSIGMSPFYPAFAFYLLPTRMWELMAGGAVYLLLRHDKPERKPARLATRSGLALIIASILFFDEATLWPGFGAIFPTLGASLVLWGNRQTGNFSGNRLLQPIGTWSYSIYLWHWPVFVALRYAELADAPLCQAGGLALSIALGAASYHLIEGPCREAAFLRKPTRRVAFAGTVLLLALTTFGVGAARTQGFQARADETQRSLQNTVAIGLGPEPQSCGKGLNAALPACQNRTPDYVVWGDSHAGAVFTSIQEAAGEKYGEIYTKSCPPLTTGYIDVRKWRSRCATYTADVLKSIQQLPPHVPVLVVFRFSYYIHGNTESTEPVFLRYHDVSESDRIQDPTGIFQNKLIETMCRATQGGRKVSVLLPIPEMGINVPRTLARRLILQGQAPDITLPRAAYDARHKTVITALKKAQALCGLDLLDPTQALCDDATCYGSRDHQAIYYDDDHLSQSGARALVPLFAKAVGAH